VVLGERTGAGCRRSGGPDSSGDQGPGHIHHVPGRDLPGTADVGGAQLPDAQVLQQGRPGRALCRLGGAAVGHRRGPGRFQGSAMTEASTAAVQPPLTRDETGTLVGQTLGLVAVTCGLFALGAYLGRDISYTWGWILFIVAFGCLIALNFVAQRSEAGAITLLFGFGVLIGLATAPTIAYYATTNPKIVWQAGGATALFIAGFGAAGYATRRDLS